MKYQTSNAWSYHIVSKCTLNFYHVLVPQIELSEILQNLSFGKQIYKETDGSVTLILTEEGHLQETIQELKLFFMDVENDFIDTPYANYAIHYFDHSILNEWYYSIIGTIALILLNDPLLKEINTGKWEFISSPIAALFVEPFTYIFTEQYVKIVHPIRVDNYALREHAEQVASNAFSNIFMRINESFPGFEGVAIASYAEDKMGISAESISSKIHENIVISKENKI